MNLFLSCVLASFMLLSMPSFLSAKASTGRITITGGGLANSIEITDGEILELSSAWGMEFLDISKPALTEAPKVSSTYEVTLYSRMEGNYVRKTCVFFYSPTSSTEQGLIYLPGKGTLWYLTAGAMIREGRDGKWNYVSPAWEASIKPLIARAEAERDSQKSWIGFGKSEALTEAWTKAKAGWLYILDPWSDPNAPCSRVWLLDPETSQVKGSVRAGYEPDFALSQDGRRLYLASGERETGELTVVDTATGNAHHVPFADRVLYNPWYQGLPPFLGMRVDSDSQILWIQKQHVLAPDRVEPQLTAFDTDTEQFVSTNTQAGRLPKTAWPRSPDGARAYIGYGGIAPDGMSAATALLVFDTATNKQIGRVQTSVPFWSAAASPDGKYVYAIAPAQHSVLVIDATTLQEKRTINVGNTPSLAIVAP